MVRYDFIIPSFVATKCSLYYSRYQTGQLNYKLNKVQIYHRPWFRQSVSAGNARHSYILENSVGSPASNIDVTADIRQIVLLLGGRGEGGYQLFDKVG